MKVFDRFVFENSDKLEILYDRLYGACRASRSRIQIVDYNTFVNFMYESTDMALLH